MDERLQHTPTVYQKGLIRFRSAVLLSYRLRGRLQAAIEHAAADLAASDQTFHTLYCFQQMLEELDVMDDSVSGERATQGKLRRCLIGPLHSSLMD